MEQLKGPPYRGSNNRRFTKQLFLEVWREMTPEHRVALPPFTLHEELDGYICFGKEYINDADPSGYTTATRLLGDFGHWEILCGIRWFREALDKWNRELEAKLYAEGLAKIREMASGDDPKALQAAKFLANKEFQNNKPKRGRPSKEEVAGNLAQESEEAKQLREDAERIRLIRSV